MDEPIRFQWRDDIRVRRKKARSLREALDNALDFDDKDEFLRLIKDPDFKRIRKFYGVRGVFRHDSLNCGIAVLNGETKGIIDIKVEEGLTPLHIAALHSSRWLTKYLLERGDSADVHSDFADLNLKQATPIDIILEKLSSGLLVIKTWTPHKSVYELLVLLCQCMRYDVEIIRMLVRNTQNKERVRQTFMDYAEKRQLVPIALLFFAAPELFLSSYSEVASSSSIATLYHVFNSLEKRTDDEEAMLLLIDAFTMAGPKFVAYTRLPYRNRDEGFKRAYLDVAFLVREFARNKQVLPSPDDYFLRFFKPMRPVADKLRNIPREKIVPNPQPWPIHWLRSDDDMSLEALPFDLKRNDLDQEYINRVLPNLTTEDGDCLNNAIEKKLISMPTLYGRLEDFIRTPNQGVKFPLLQGFPFRFSSSLQSVCTYMASAKYRLDFRNTTTNSWRNKLMKPNKKLYPLFSRVKLLQFSNMVKRLIK
ncbi:uncharacterized protein LOC141595811 [Silene latifolia]|uniref:uncharacterized protein LOC141595811 n=1 Tax=Silene latifolia TaxID=37657 RepID=UPI003D76D614